MFNPDTSAQDADPRYDKQMQSGTKPRNQDAWDRLPQDTPTAPVKRNRLDKPEMQELHSTLIGYYRRELLRQDQNRREMATDADFYDGIQLSQSMIAHMRDRGQTPLTFNVISNVINWMLGSERRARTDYKILPRKEEASQAAERKSQLLKYLGDVNRTPFHISRAFADAVKVGIGWMEDGVQEDDEGEAIYSRYESWRNVLHDSAATELDMSDGRYIFRSKWTDVDVATSMFPDRKAQLEAAATTNLALTRALDAFGDDAMDSIEEDIAQSTYATDINGYRDRRRVRLIECWYRMPSEDKYIKGGQFSGEIYDSKSPGHVTEFLTGQAQIVTKTKMRVHVAIMTEQDMLWQSKSPYRHNRFPLTPIWCYRRDRDNLPYGIVRQMRDPQIDINHRAAKALHILNSSKVIMDEGAVDDLDAFEVENARADGIIIKKQGKELRLDVERGLEQSHLDMMSRSISLIQAMTGVTDENMGKSTNATSGKAIMARQDQGSLATAPIFDRLRLAKQISGEKQLSLIEQFMPEQRQFRITNQRGNPSFITINDGLPENDIVATKADFIVSEDDFSATMRQAQVEELLNLMGQLAGTGPQIVMATLDLIVETMDIPQREEIVKRIRQITGMEDPDADPNNPDPETLARKAAAEEQAAFEKEMAMTELANKKAEAAKKSAEAERITTEMRKIAADVRRIIAQTEGESVETQVRALEAAARIMASPQSAGIADQVLDGAGFQDRTDIAKLSQAKRMLGRGDPIAPIDAPPAGPQPTQPQPAMETAL
jgi:hypothetical protein